MSEQSIIDSLFISAFSLITNLEGDKAAEARGKAMWEAVPKLKKVGFLAKVPFLLKKLGFNLMDIPAMAGNKDAQKAAFEKVLSCPEETKIEFIQFADSFMGSIKGRYAEYDKLPDFWEDHMLRPEVIEYLKQHKCQNFAELATAAAAKGPSRPTGPVAGPDTPKP